MESIVETEQELKVRWEAKFEKEKHLHPPRPLFGPVERPRRLLQIKYWDRTPEMQQRKLNHTSSLDLSKVRRAFTYTSCDANNTKYQQQVMTREEHILATTLKVSFFCF